MSERVLITGGSEGIGYAFARCYGRQGAELYLCARREEKLHQAAEQLQKDYACQVHIIPGDLSVMTSVQALHHYFEDKVPDVVINNAGIGYTGRALDRTMAEDDQLVDLNVKALMNLTRMFARDMVGKGKGLIINIASTGAYQPGPYIAAYYASKAFVLSYSEGLNEELKGTGVHICTVCPGPVDTAFYEKSGGKRPPLYMKPEAVAAYALKHTDKDVVIPGFTNRLARYLPVRMKLRAVGWMKAAGQSDHTEHR